MNLSARLTVFFLVALGVVVLGFSITLYGLASNHLYHQLDARLDAALDTLVAAAELKPGGFEWEPKERRLTLGQGAGTEEIRWLIRDEKDELVDRSRNLDSVDLATALAGMAQENQFAQLIDSKGQEWRLLRRRLEADGGKVTPAPVENPAQAERIYKKLIITGAISQVPVQRTLNRLALALCGIALGLWCVAALSARSLCRRALIPVTTMAATARAMSASDWEQRLPNPKTGDELEDLSRSFNDLLTRLQEAFERQRRFTGDASHQLRTPLTAMLGQIEVSLRRARSADEYHQVLALVQEQAQQLRHIVEMLLFLARADAEARLPNLETMDLVTWLDKYQQRLAEHPRAGDLHFECNFENRIRAKVQPPLLAQLLDNLLDNACKYSAPGNAVTVRLERDAGNVKLSVEDAGQGIAAADLPHVFEPFYRSADARRRGTAGIGLGLAVVQRIAAAFGGSVSARSDPGSFTRFTLELPEVKVTELAPVAI